MAESYVAHVLFDDDGRPVREQGLQEHLSGTAELAADFASAFHAEAWGRAAGRLHDVGKSSPQGQKRMRDPQHTAKCDHSTRGAQAAWERGSLPLAYAIAGHHGHLPDGGDKHEQDGSAGTLMGRLVKQVPDCGAFLSDWPVDIPAVQTLRSWIRPYGKADSACFSLAFFIRMLHSCLVDADWLDTERFLKPGQAARGKFLPLEMLAARLTAYLRGFAGKTGLVNDARQEILASCLEAADGPVGFYTLTVPTGGGKTLSSLAFALRHAVRHGLSRVIYVIPYTSILEQTVDCFSRALGADQVVAHYADAFAADSEEDGEDDALHRKHLAAENWDARIIVTTSVQFFESLYASHPGRCRKLHNLAGSVIVLDEAQLLPTPYLLPCLRALGELTTNYGATVVMMSATQPELRQFIPEDVPVREITREIPRLYSALKRAAIIREDGVRDEKTLAGRLTEEKQTLCVVNTRRRARSLYSLLPAAGRYHLSTLMLPADRRRVLKEVREALDAGRTCRLVSTSLIEAGVDVDFPCGWREESGLDSLLQAAGRVNREGRRRAEDSVLRVFRLDGSQDFADMKQRAEVARMVLEGFPDATAPGAIAAYFDCLYHYKGRETLDTKQVLERFRRQDQLFPFDSVAREFRLIDEDTVSVVIPGADEAGARLLARLNAGDLDRALLREAGASAVQLRRDEAKRLYAQTGAIRPVTDNLYLLVDTARYDPNLGLDLSGVAGAAKFA